MHINHIYGNYPFYRKRPSEVIGFRRPIFYDHLNLYLILGIEKYERMIINVKNSLLTQKIVMALLQGLHQHIEFLITVVYFSLAYENVLE